MSEKNLLEESTIRRFMKLANIPAVKSDLLSEGKGAGQDPAGGRGFGVTRDEDRGNLGPNGQGYGKGGKKPSHGGAVKPKGGPKLKEAYKEEMEEAEDLDGEKVEEELELEAADDEGAAEMPAPEMGGDELGLGGDESTGEEEGGDIEADVEEIASRLSSILAKMGSSKEVAVEKEPEAGGEEGSDIGAEVGGEEEAPMMESDELEEELYESLEVDDDEKLAEELTRRVAARLVAEMKKAKEDGKKGKKKEEEGKKKKVEEGKGAGNWLKKVAPAKKPKGHPVGTGKKATPFTKAAKKVGGLGGRGR